VSRYTRLVDPVDSLVAGVLVSERGEDITTIFILRSSFPPSFVTVETTQGLARASGAIIRKRRHHSMEKRFPRTIASLPTLFHAVDEFFENSGLSPDLAFSTHIVVEELFTNFVRHNIGGGDHILFSIDTGPKGLTVRLVDYDVEPFDETAVAPVDTNLPIEQRRSGGLGLHLVRNVFDDLKYHFSDGVLEAEAVKHLEEKSVRNKEG
jgi:serine/threonine-protein kinase RsbW